ncbi:tryptophan 7-halogenase [Caulobacter sp. SL161]|uniref:tryptophan halogenase family protein n=1 Tax=Caulobacter sp. SL161 TaxID=2995156 RepID=UPI0022767B7F|nr:tryptophan halogenase family protein [Caulobacter sp. SL161]MCY1647544.1 tryptophan 7-halogenase [Caulobacter sp. SL161]
MGEAIQSIVILGGGSAGWMAAALLNAALGKRCAVTVVESAEIGVVGVGEATIPAIRQFNAMVGLKEPAFMRATRATLKLGIEFVDWGCSGERYLHPFGVLGGQPTLGVFPQHFLRLMAADPDASLEDYSVCALAARLGRAGPTATDPATPLSQLMSAYHFDAVLYGRFLRRLAEGRGVRRIEGEVVAVDQRPEDGFVERLRLKDGREVEGELFIDCSGFRGLLIEGALAAGYDDWSRWLPVDRAIAAPCAKVGPAAPYTQSTAQEAGWRWRIPLQHRTGNGYVYSSAFTDDDRAETVLREGLDGALEAEPRKLRFVTGRRRAAWKANVVALGLASGFIEPLESTSLHMVHSGLQALLKFFPDRSFSPVLRAGYNAAVKAEGELIRDFIILHYHATRLSGDPFWDYVRTMPIPDSLAERVALYAERGVLVSGSDELFSPSSWMAVMHGQGLRPRRASPLYDGVNSATLATEYAATARRLRRSVEALPLHEAYLQDAGAWAEPEA